jgi:acetylornithine deacetylase/succinyl-diaminopimelate desuccinylase-like protein
MNNKSKSFSFNDLSHPSEKIQDMWNSRVQKTFDEYLSIPNVSPAFDFSWEANGHINNVMQLFEKWARDNAPTSAEVHMQTIDGKTPLLIIDISAHDYAGDDAVLLYGHSDKQPPMYGWREGIEPFTATYIDDKIYGRGSVDDGYALFAATLASLCIDDQPHARLVIVIEASEESGSPDLIEHLDIIDQTLTKPLGNVSLVVCLDSGCYSYEHLWITRSLRGLMQINLDVKVLEEGVHSGGNGGYAPSPFHIARALIDRIAEPATGKILVEDLHMAITDEVRNRAQRAADVIEGKENEFSVLADGVEPLQTEIVEQILATTYEPQLEIIGLEGLPDIENAGNVIRPHITFALSFRLPPKVDPLIAAGAVSEMFLKDVPFNAQITVQVDSLAQGWEAPEDENWLAQATRETAREHFDEDVQFQGEGGTIPFMAMLGERYPQAQFFVTGVAGPNSHAHGPNEFIHVPTCFRVTACVADVLRAHGSR